MKWTDREAGLNKYRMRETATQTKDDSIIFKSVSCRYFKPWENALFKLSKGRMNNG